jgi:erythromycin esterase
MIPFPLPRPLVHIIVGALSLQSLAQQPLNLGFEMPGVTGTDRPWGWEGHWMWSAGTSTMDSTTVMEGRYSFRLDLPPADSSTAPPTHAMMMRIPASSLQGQRIALAVHTAGTDACVFLNTWGDPGQVDSVVFRKENGDPWRSAELAVRIGPSDYQLVITVQALSSGPVWFDAFTLTADGKPITALPCGTAPSTADMDAIRMHCAPIDVMRLPAPTDEPWPIGYKEFDRAVGSAQVVSLGESTHGTHEFFVTKHHLFRYLVEEKGFTVFAIEANQLATERINAFVNGAKDTVENAMGGLFGVWYKQEVKDLIEWMRQYNARKPDRPLSFVGFDMQDPEQPMDSVVAYLRRHDPAIADEVLDLLAPHREAWRKGDYPRPAEGEGAQWLANAKRAQDLLAQRMLDTPPDQVLERRWALQNARVVVQCAAQAYDPWNPTIRDSCMAANIAWTLTRYPEGTRMAVWAHDAHIGRVGFANGTSMGAHMARIFGDRLRVVGITTYDGSYRATRGFTDHRPMDARCFPAPVGSLEEAMHRILPANSEALFLNVRALAADPQSRWIHSPRPVRSIGYSAFDFGFEQPTVLADQFDAVLMIDRTTPSQNVN